MICSRAGEMNWLTGGRRVDAELAIDESTSVVGFENELRANAAYYRLNQPL